MKLCLSDVIAARGSIQTHVVRTPLLPAPCLSALLGVPLHMKMEIMQPVGAFKLRGAMNAALSAPEGTHTLACCSTGNHGRAVAYAARQLGLKAAVFMSSLVPQTKIEGIRRLSGEVQITGRSQDDAQIACDAYSESPGVHAISPFDDLHVIAGQGTIGVEMLEDLPDLETLLVPLSGGGLAAGVALAARTIKPGIRLIGVSMDRGAAMKASLDAGEPVEVSEVESLADSLGGGIGLQNRFSYSMCQDYLDDVVLVSEEEIYQAMQTLYFEENLVAEGGAVVGIAALMSRKIADLNGPVATIVSGRNVDMKQFTDVVSGRDVVLGDLLVKGQSYGA
ncbi:MAG: hydroxyectoine utilization dehydratase EutB [Rhodobacteraceae bacterium]|nr:hydroxyectoine utilization dehydratase EutB [Paracoccaceae bacterium]